MIILVPVKKLTAQNFVKKTYFCKATSIRSTKNNRHINNSIEIVQLTLFSIAPLWAPNVGPTINVCIEQS